MVSTDEYVMLLKVRTMSADELFFGCCCFFNYRSLNVDAVCRCVSFRPNICSEQERKELVSFLIVFVFSSCESFQFGHKSILNTHTCARAHTHVHTHTHVHIYYNM